jgi:hypothetical protein
MDLFFPTNKASSLLVLGHVNMFFKKDAVTLK